MTKVRLTKFGNIGVRSAALTLTERLVHVVDLVENDLFWPVAFHFVFSCFSSHDRAKAGTTYVTPQIAQV